MKARMQASFSHTQTNRSDTRARMQGKQRRARVVCLCVHHQEVKTDRETMHWTGRQCRDCACEEFNPLSLLHCLSKAKEVLQDTRHRTQVAREYSASQATAAASERREAGAAAAATLLSFPPSLLRATRVNMGLNGRDASRSADGVLLHVWESGCSSCSDSRLSLPRSCTRAR